MAAAPRGVRWLYPVFESVWNIESKPSNIIGTAGLACAFVWRDVNPPRTEVLLNTKRPSGDL
jgi:hypothetical protein